ncbi:MAG: hypothetical protein V1857_02980 [archaeon]
MCWSPTHGLKRRIRKHDIFPILKKDIDPEVNEESIDLSAELCQLAKYDLWGTAQRDCEFNRLSTTIRMLAEDVLDSSVARFKGVLTVELSKKMRKRRIPVQ